MRRRHWAPGQHQVGHLGQWARTATKKSDDALKGRRSQVDNLSSSRRPSFGGIREEVVEVVTPPGTEADREATVRS